MVKIEAYNLTKFSTFRHKNIHKSFGKLFAKKLWILWKTIFQLNFHRFLQYLRRP